MKKTLLLFSFALAAMLSVAQERIVTGKVTGADDGQPVPGANILVKGTSQGTTTNSEGGFSISVGNNSVLVVSYIGFATQEIAVGDQTTISIVLQTDVTSLADIVVVGYGEVEKKDVTGAVVAISSKDFNRGVITSPQDLLVGRVAGVSISSNSGAPGANSTIRIRGGASLNANNDPLIVIDGFPVDNNSPAGVANPLASLNPNDIESYTVLKDASATAIYGSRASNGVIIITTKKGSKNKNELTYNGTVAISTPVKYLDVMTGDEYRDLVAELVADGGYGITATAESQLGTANTDWQKEIFQTSVSHDHNISAAGAVKNLPYRISYGYTDQQGILKTTNTKRHSVNVNVSPTLLDGNLKLNLSVKGSYTKNNFGDAGAVGNAVSYDPTQEVYDETTPQYGGYFSWLKYGIGAANNNPVAMLEQTDNQSEANRIIGNMLAEYKLPFFPDVKVNLNLGFDRTGTDGANKAPITAEFVRSGLTTTLIGRNNSYSARNQSELLDLYFTYAKEMGSHKVDVTLGYGWQHFYRGSKSTNVSTLNTAKFVDKGENYLVSFFGRANYSFQGKYLLTGTVRYDGSSRFSEDTRWGLFPSAAIAWRIKDEGFLSGVSFISDLKLRAGYGVTGQQDVGNYYPYLSIYRESDPRSQYQLGNTFYTTLRPNAYDANIKWEETTTYNVGLDFGLMGDKISGSVEYFQKDTKDLLNFIPIPNGVNFSNFLLTNVGSLTNNGYEVTLNYRPVTRQDFTWNIGANFTRITSEITKLNLRDDPEYLGVPVGGIGVDANIQIHSIGEAASTFFPYQQVYDEAGKPVEGLYVDRSGDGGSVVGNSRNKYHFNNPVPDFLIGLNSRLNYKAFDFSFSSRLSIGNYVYNNVESGRAFYNGVFSQNHFRNVPNSIRETNFVSQQIYSDYYVEDASFFKMDNIGLGYSLDKLPVDKLKARISFTVQNAFIITKYSGIDPEVVGGIDNNIYPRPRTYLVGLNLTF